MPVESLSSPAQSFSSKIIIRSNPCHHSPPTHLEIKRTTGIWLVKAMNAGERLRFADLL